MHMFTIKYFAIMLWNKTMYNTKFHTMDNSGVEVATLA